MMIEGATMTDQDNLRERIERQLCVFFDENYDGHLFDASQAIIDEFWLEVVSGGGRPGQRQQIVGRWERQ